MHQDQLQLRKHHLRKQMAVHFQIGVIHLVRRNEAGSGSSALLMPMYFGHVTRAGMIDIN